MKIRHLMMAFTTATLISWATASITKNDNNQFVETFAAQSSDLYVNFILTLLTGTLSYNGFA